MVTNNVSKPASDAGFFEKNFLKLKEGQLWEYIISRIIMFLAGITVGLYYVHDAAYAHSKTGVPESILLAVALIFLMNGVRKMVWGLIKRQSAAWDTSVVEKPYNPGESLIQRMLLRFPMGRRRHLVSAMTLGSEGLVSLLLFASLVAIGINEKLFMLSSDFPYVLKPFVWSEMTFPVNSWMGLAIVAIARGISYINSSSFLTKIPQVRKSLMGTVGKILNGKSPLRAIGLEMFDFYQEKNTANPDCCKEELATEAIAKLVLSVYKKKEELNGHYDELLGLLVGELMRQEYDIDSLPVLLRYLDDQLSVIKKRQMKV